MNFDFAAFLLLASVVTGIIWALDSMYWAKPRAAAATADAPAQEPVVVEYAKSFFPIILIVLLLRSFLVEPFRIPSGSMMPTLLVGDFILVNKFTYGIRLPVLNKKVVEMNNPERGDVAVFRYPKDPSADYIKRIVGLPGDTIGYFNKVVFVNGEPAVQVALGRYHGENSSAVMNGASHRRENLLGVHGSILVQERRPTIEGEFQVPHGQYFVMGDNRDNSNDSRYWGFVPEQNLVGKAFFVWMSWDSGIAFDRLGQSIK